MILDFSVTNFLSFKDKNTFKMTSTNNTSLENILKCSSIFGLNGSGKSNLFKILSLVSNMLNYSNARKLEEKLPIKPFIFNDKKKPSEFSITFIINNIKYLYGFIADENVIYNEYFYYYPKGRAVKLFDRKDINDYYVNYEDQKILNNIKSVMSPNKFFLAATANWNYSKTKDAFLFLTNKLNIIYTYDDILPYSYMLYNDNLKSFSKEIFNYLKLNIKDYEFNNGIIKTTHLVNNKIYNLTLEEEGYGMKFLFSLIPVLYDTFNNGKILIIDEIDRSLNSFIVKDIIKLFNSNYNKTNSQLIFTTHDTNLLDLTLLRKDQIWFIEKNKNEESILSPLNILPIRKKENIIKDYFEGKYKLLT